jgi:hypothetical protein
MRLPIAITVVSLVVAGIGMSCKPPAGSEVQSLENFAAGKVLRTNVCSANIDEIEPGDLDKFEIMVDEKDPVKKDLIWSVVRLSMSAIPDELKYLLQLDNTKVLVTPNAKQLCGANAFATGSDSFKDRKAVSCFIHTNDTTESMKGMTFVFSPHPAYINHILVRNVGYAYSQYYAWKYTLVDRNGNPTKVNTVNYADLRMNLAEAFLQDIASSKAFDLKDMSKLLGHNAAEVIPPALKAGKNPFQRLSWSASGKNLPASVKSKMESSFKDYVVGEAFDSYFCNSWDKAWPSDAVASIKGGNLSGFAKIKNTRRIMKEFFPRTYKAFEPVREHFEALSVTTWKNAAQAIGVNDGLDRQKRSARQGASFGLQDAGGGWDPPGPVREAAWENSANSKAYKTAVEQRKYWEEQKAGCWVRCDARYDHLIQEASYKGQLARRDAMLAEIEAKRVELAPKAEPMVDNFKGSRELEDPRKAYNEALTKHVDDTITGVKTYVNSETLSEQLAANAQNSDSATGAFFNQLGAQTIRVSKSITNTLADTMGGTAKTIGVGANNAEVGLTNASAYVSDTATVMKKAYDDSVAAGDSGGAAPTVKERLAAAYSAAGAGAEKLQVGAGEAILAGEEKVKTWANNAQTAYNKGVDNTVTRYNNMTAQGVNPVIAMSSSALSELGPVASAVDPTGLTHMPANLISTNTGIVVNSSGIDMDSSTYNPDGAYKKAADGAGNQAATVMMDVVTDRAKEAAWEGIRDYGGKGNVLRNMEAANLNMNRRVDALGRSMGDSAAGWTGGLPADANWADRLVHTGTTEALRAGGNAVPGAVISAGQSGAQGFFDNVTNYDANANIEANMNQQMMDNNAQQFGEPSSPGFSSPPADQGTTVQPAAEPQQQQQPADQTFDMPSE